MNVLPFSQVRRTIEQNATALFANTRADAQIPEVTVAPEKWIAESGKRRVSRGFDNRSVPFNPGAELRLGRSGEALHFAEVLRSVAKRGEFGRDGFYSRVDEGWGPAIDYGTAGEASVGVVPSGRGSKCNRHVAPVNHVRAHSVGPVHVAPNGRAWIVLEKHVVAAFPENGTVRIIHPIFGRQQMKLRAKRIGGETCQGIIRGELKSV
jgi:hypothetical protein